MIAGAVEVARTKIPVPHYWKDGIGKVILLKGIHADFIGIYPLIRAN